ncbi:MAG: disulfide bond formation protein B [Methylobacterium frigidaeris]
MVTPFLARRLNLLGLLACCGILLVAFWYQFRFGEVPCPLCQLQRAAFAAAGLGLVLNVVHGPRPSHYAVTILSAAAGALVAARQIALHVVPGTGAYGSALLGLHFYTWSLIAFAGMIVAASALCLFDRQFAADGESGPRGRGIVGTGCVVLFLVLTLGNAASTTAICGAGLCPDDPAGYELLDRFLAVPRP